MEEFNDDELVAPTWLDKQFLENVLKHCEKTDTIKVKDVKITPGTAKGDHYASIMFRAAVTYETINSKDNFKSMIIKTLPELDTPKGQMFGESSIFETEIAMYWEAIPKLEAELRKIGDDTVLKAKALFYTLEPRKCIVFEDIVPLGYKPHQDRFLSMEDAMPAIYKLAKWHAVSYKLANEGDDTMTKFNKPFYESGTLETMPFIKTGIETFVEKIKTIETYKEYVPKLESLNNTLFSNAISGIHSYRNNTSSQGIFVLCHGDFQSKNLMFKRNDKGELEDVMLIDFQGSFFGPGIIDIINAKYMLADPDTLCNHYDEVIYHYASTFIDTLKKLKFTGKIPTVADFFIDVLRQRHYELLLLSAFHPLWVMLANKNCNDIEQLVSSIEVRKKTYENEDYLNVINIILPKLIHKGYLE